MHVAVKTIVRGEVAPELRELIVDEVADMLKVMHPNCIRTLGVTEHPGRHVSLVVEWLDGGALCDLLQRSPSASEQRRLDVFMNVCSAGLHLPSSPTHFKQYLLCDHPPPPPLSASHPHYDLPPHRPPPHPRTRAPDRRRHRQDPSLGPTGGCQF
jgi:serine/threonine protein kinase